MTNFQLYVRLLTETSHHHGQRSTNSTRLTLQDVLCELRNRAAQDLGDPLGQETQDEAEAEALRVVQNEPPRATVPLAVLK
jgi:hypothetical protein